MFDIGTRSTPASLITELEIREDTVRFRSGIKPCNSETTLCILHADSGAQTAVLRLPIRGRSAFPIEAARLADPKRHFPLLPEVMILPAPFGRRGYLRHAVLLATRLRT